LRATRCNTLGGSTRHLAGENDFHHRLMNTLAIPRPLAVGILVPDGIDATIDLLPASRDFHYSIFVSLVDLAEVGQSILFDLVVLMLPAVSGPGLAFVDQVRKLGFDTPLVVIVTTPDANGSAHAFHDRIDGFISDPRSSEIVAAGLIAAHQCHSLSREDRGATFRLGDYVLDMRQHCVLLRGVAVKLSDRQFRLALMLFRSAGKTLTRASIELEIWGARLPTSSRALSTLISTLRMQLGMRSRGPISIHAVSGFGYRLEVGAPAGKMSQSAVEDEDVSHARQAA
ncbi:MAG TPA: DNA-binding response regulator, partial [Cupriavidus sp.]|nr:DNA-binding response regulator [Cupriavidus sp.]